MAWTYPELKAADAALGIDDPEQAAAALSAQTVTVTMDIATADARAVLLLSGEWFKVKQLAKMPLSGASPPSPQDQAVAAADICIDTLTLTEALHFADDVQWQAAQPMIQGLLAAGVVSPASAAAWVALRTKTMLVWAPPPTDQDILHARSL